MCQNSSHMESDLRGRHHIEPSICVHMCKRTEVFHHGLLVCFRVISLLYVIFTIFQHLVYIAFLCLIVGTEISAIIRPNFTESFPVFFRMHQDLVIFRLPEIKDRLQHFIIYFYKLHSLCHCFFRDTGNHCHRISDKTYPVV